METTKLLAYARTLATELERDMRWVQSEYGNGGYWQASNGRSDLPKIVSRATAALEFLRRYAGPDTVWTRQANATYVQKGDGQSTESGARALADLILAWADQVEAGIIEIHGANALDEIGVVSTDLMGQVNDLLANKNVHPAAPIVLCGAALEVALRATVEVRDLVLTEKASIGAYARLLRKADLITVQDVKDIEQCGGLRNSAAHGDFNDLSRERAGLMEQQTNLILRRLADLAPD